MGYPAGVWYYCQAFVMWFILGVLDGPSLIMLLAGCLAIPFLAVVALVITVRLATRPPRGRRVLLVAAVSGCLVTAFAVRPG